MDKAELLSKFTGQVDLFEKYQTFIEKAQSQSGRFSAAVVERVVADNTAKSLEIVSEIVPMMADLDGVIQDLDEQRQQITEGVSQSQFKLEELELRHMIGELDDDSFAAEAEELKSVVARADADVSALDIELGEFRGAVARWTELGKAAGMVDETVPEPVPEPAADEVAVDDDDDDDDDDDGDDEPEVDDDDDDDDAAQSLVSFDEPLVEIDADDDDSSDEPAGDDDSEIDIEVDDGSEPELDLGADDADSGFEVGDLDILGDDEELDLDGGDPVVDTEQHEKPRRAVLLYQEGTAEEQIYPFSGEVLSLGRGRDNDVQVKNDSKVSRYHCKLYRRGPNFYIEDNKSANGTLVNGELITERRLFGGEEVIIGETFFRFRILD
ncbi:MAG: hypothetical protein ACI8PZ_000643 [Myxococcota bacterium]|jgi:hypothetical protein